LYVLMRYHVTGENYS